MTQFKRRYPDQRMIEHSIYNDFFDNYLTKSDVLNQDGNVGVRSELWDRPSLLNAIHRLTGDKDGNVISGKEKFKASISATEEKLLELEARFQAYSDRREDEGHKKPKNWPDNLLTERLKTEAKLDVYQRELESLQNELKKFDEKEKEKQSTVLLSFGPLGQGRVQNGELVEIDFQPVERVHGTLVITEGRYRGMKISDYREFVSEPWCAEYYANRKTLELKQRKEILEKGHSSVKVPRGLGINKISAGSLPPWPKGVKNYLNGEDKK